jgi:hypothetical protein
MRLNNFYKTILPLFFTTLVANAMSFSTNRNYLGYNLIYASGHIKNGDLERLKNRYYSLPNNKQTIVVFNSYGGELYEGLNIGRFLKRNHIGSAVRRNGICASSCALAFLGGRAKNGKRLMILPYSSSLGLHSFYYKNGNYVKLEKVQEDLANILSYASYVGAPHYLMANMFKTKSNNMYWINQQDRVVLRLKSSLNLHQKGRYIAKQYYQRGAVRYIKSYFSKVNNMIASSRGSNLYSTDAALSSIRYKTWMSRNLKYVHLKSIKQLQSNVVEAKVIYSLNNGKRICSVNRYTLAKNYTNSWKIIRKVYKGCDYSSTRELKRLAKALP